jgi:hypothetical protein
MSRAALLPILLTCTAALAACGSSSSASSSGSVTNASAAAGRPDPAAFAKFRSCLKAQGVDVPAGPPAGGPPPSASTATPPTGARPARTAAQRKAMQACAKYQPQGGFRGGGLGARRDPKAFTAYLTCLKDQGLAVDTAAGFNALRNIKRNDPKLAPALKACASKLPQRPQGAPPASTATPPATN